MPVYPFSKPSGLDGPTFKDQFNDFLADREKQVANWIGVGPAMQYASSRPAELGYTDDHRGEGDALRHLLLAATLQQKFPRFASPLLWAHENITNVLQGQRPEEREQDTFNNKLGLQIGRQAQTPQQLEQMATGLLKLGQARVLSPTNYGP